MKKKSVFAILTISALILSGCSVGQTEVKNVGTDIAKAAALKEAGLEEEAVVFDKTELNSRNGQEYYGIDFSYNGYRYSCDIDAVTGKVINFREQGGEPAAAKDTIDKEQAKEIALKHAGVSADQTVFVKSELDREDGRQVYEIEFYTKDNKEYDYDIDVNSGEVLFYDHDAEGYAPKASEDTISEEQAKGIALEQVPGATDDDIRAFKADYDDGRKEFEGKIYYNGMEYEFEIDGYSGAIRGWEAEPIERWEN